MKIKESRGSYTVEAALLFPLILSVFILLFSEACLLHDRAALAAAAEAAALRGSGVKDRKAGPAEAAEAAAEMLVKKSLFATRNVKVSARVEGKSIKIELEGSFISPGSFMLPLGGQVFPDKLSMSAEASMIQPAEALRAVRESLHAAERLKRKKEAGT